MTDPGDDLRDLRDALYRRDATGEDRRRYEAALVGTEGEAPSEPAPRPRPRRRRVLLAAGCAVVLGAGAAAIAVLTPHGPGVPEVASTPIALLGSAGERAGAQADLAALFNHRDPFLGLYLAQHRTALSASLRSDSIAVDGRGTGPTTVSLVGILSDSGQATGLLTVLFVCDRPGTSYSWVLEGPPDASGRPVRTAASGSDCGSGIVTATFVPRPHHVPTRIRITVPEGVRSIVEVDLSKY